MPRSQYPWILCSLYSYDMTVIRTCLYNIVCMVLNNVIQLVFMTKCPLWHFKLGLWYNNIAEQYNVHCYHGNIALWLLDNFQSKEKKYRNVLVLCKCIKQI